MNINPIRIKTMAGDYKIFTHYFGGKWITGATCDWNYCAPSPHITDNLFEAGEEHLRLAKLYATRT